MCDEVGIQLDEIDTSNSPELIAIHGEEVPTGYLDGRKVFKCRAESNRARGLLRIVIQRKSAHQLKQKPISSRIQSHSTILRGEQRNDI